MAVLAAQESKSGVNGQISGFATSDGYGAHDVTRDTKTMRVPSRAPTFVAPPDGFKDGLGPEAESFGAPQRIRDVDQSQRRARTVAAIVVTAAVLGLTGLGALVVNAVRHH